MSLSAVLSFIDEIGKAATAHECRRQIDALRQKKKARTTTVITITTDGESEQCPSQCSVNSSSSSQTEKSEASSQPSPPPSPSQSTPDSDRKASTSTAPQPGSSSGNDSPSHRQSSNRDNEEQKLSYKELLSKLSRDERLAMNQRRVNRLKTIAIENFIELAALAADLSAEISVAVNQIEKPDASGHIDLTFTDFDAPTFDLTELPRTILRNYANRKIERFQALALAAEKTPLLTWNDTRAYCVEFQNGERSFGHYQLQQMAGEIEPNAPYPARVVEIGLITADPNLACELAAELIWTGAAQVRNARHWMQMAQAFRDEFAVVENDGNSTRYFQTELEAQVFAACHAPGTHHIMDLTTKQAVRLMGPNRLDFLSWDEMHKQAWSSYLRNQDLPGTDWTRM